MIAYSRGTRFRCGGTRDSTRRGGSTSSAGGRGFQARNDACTDNRWWDALLREGRSLFHETLVVAEMERDIVGLDGGGNQERQIDQERDD